MNLGQRIVVVIGLGVGLMVFGEWATTPRAYGWVGFAPLSNSATYSPFGGGFHPWVRLLIWLALVIG